MCENKNVENLLLVYDIYKGVKDYPNILDPQCKFIRNNNLHWDSHKFVLISKYLKDIENYINGGITENELVDKFKVGDDSDLSLFKKQPKTKDEIDNLYNIGIKSVSSKETVLKNINDSEMVDDDLHEIIHTVREIIFNRRIEKSK